jgi:hypothetical protein
MDPGLSSLPFLAAVFLPLSEKPLLALPPDALCAPPHPKRPDWVDEKVCCPGQRRSLLVLWVSPKLRLTSAVSAATLDSCFERVAPFWLPKDPGSARLSSS